MNVALNIDLGADILGSDGEKLGVVDSLVVDPTTGAVHSVVVRSGLFFPTDRIISAHLIQSISEDGIVVSMSSDDAEELPEYLDADYMWPPAGFYGQAGYMWPAAAVYAAPAADLLIDEQIHERDPNAIILSEGTLVLDRNGDDVGHVTEIASDERGRVAGFRVEKGFFRHHDHYIPAHFVERAEDRAVRLSVDKEALEGITRPADLGGDESRI